MAAADAPDEEPGRAPEVPRRAVEGLVATVPPQPVSVQRAAKRAAPAASVPEFDNEEIQDTPRLRKVTQLAWHVLLSTCASCQHLACQAGSLESTAWAEDLQ